MSSTSPDYLELKSAILGRMKDLFAPPIVPVVDVARDDYVVPYAQLHEQIVDLIADPYRDGSDPKRRAQKAIAVMEEKGALNVGDPPLLTELLDVSLADTDENPPERLENIMAIAGRIRAHRASPAALAISETAEQSGIRAVKGFASGESTSTGMASTVWKRLVWPDIEGAFSGGAAAAAAAPAFASNVFGWPLQVATAFGVVIGAGIRSGAAYGESGVLRKALSH